MARSLPCLKSAVTALFLAQPALAEGDALDPLYEALKGAEGRSAEEIAQKIWDEWSKSGSPSMDLMLERGREAMAENEFDRAIEHLSVLTEQAPEFAEGWNARATAYYRKGLYGLALGDIRRTLALNPRHFGALSGLGVILEELGFDAEALAAWREVEALNPSQENATETIRRLSRSVEGQTL